MASDYSRTCVSPDSIQTGEAPVVSESCEVYVWGSNSSHQLVEGTQEKILQPKLAASFADAQTVRRFVSAHTTQTFCTCTCHQLRFKRIATLKPGLNHLVMIIIDYIE